MTDKEDVVKMNELAMRIYDGQSPNLSVRDRTERIIRGLKEQGYTDFKKLSLPMENFKKWI